MSTIPPRGQSLKNQGVGHQTLPVFGRTERTMRTEDVGTVTQIPAQTARPIPKTVDDPAFQDHFWSKVNQTGSCWPFRHLDNHGYGRIRPPGGRAQFRAHRVAYYLHYGMDPVGKLVCHKCDNPKCVRPDHLFLGSHGDNMADKMAKGRDSYGDQTGANNGNAKLTEGDVARIVQMLKAGKSNKAIAGEMNVGHSLISRIRVGRSWRELSLKLGYTPKPAKGAPKSGRTKCTIR